MLPIANIVTKIWKKWDENIDESMLKVGTGENFHSPYDIISE
jgi:hypothetical protein